MDTWTITLPNGRQLGAEADNEELARAVAAATLERGELPEGATCVRTGVEA